MSASGQLLTAAEEQWLAQRVAALRLHAGVPTDHRFTPAELDARLALWQPTARPGDETDQMITAFGAAFGQCLVDALGWTWVKVDGETGPDVAVQPSGGVPLLRPLTVVGEKHDARETGFFATTCAELTATSARQPRGRRPWWRFW